MVNLSKLRGVSSLHWIDESYIHMYSRFTNKKGAENSRCIVKDDRWRFLRWTTEKGHAPGAKRRAKSRGGTLQPFNLNHSSNRSFAKRAFIVRAHNVVHT